MTWREIKIGTFIFALCLLGALATVGIYTQASGTTSSAWLLLPLFTCLAAAILVSELLAQKKKPSRSRPSWTMVAIVAGAGLGVIDWESVWAHLKDLLTRKKAPSEGILDTRKSEDVYSQREQATVFVQPDVLRDLVQARLAVSTLEQQRVEQMWSGGSLGPLPYGFSQQTDASRQYDVRAFDSIGGLPLAV